ncbi:MAG TPA: DUF1549 domain-containing protein [Gemmatales bacterium]|nr:DUF1549 domain-containing protein [Gemmatales bacterium]
MFLVYFHLAFGLASLPEAQKLAEPVYPRIDTLIIKSMPKEQLTAVTASADSEIIRRLYLDLLGTIPSAQEARTFLNEKSTNKRNQLIDQLLARPEHARHMSHVVDVMLMDRRPDQRVPTAEWQAYLYTAFAENRPWDQLIREILSADGSDPKTRPAAKFLLDRDGEVNQITRDVSRLFFGRNLQCAQCHDHPLVNDYKQEHYYGLAAFFNRTSLFPNGEDKKAVLAEKAEGEVSFQDVFDKAKKVKTTKPRLISLTAINEPAFDKGKEYKVPPKKGEKPQPVFSRRAQLAPILTSKDNHAFARATVNRFWAMLMGRGLIHPLDLDNSENPPSHPAILDLLTKEFIAHHYNLRWLLREITMSQAYQRSSEVPVQLKEIDPTKWVVAPLKPLSPEQMAFAMMQATGLTDAERTALGTKCTEATLYAKLSPQVSPFVSTFGTRPGEPEGHSFLATLEQSLFLKNGSVLRDWLSIRNANLMDRLTRMKDEAQITDDLFLSILTRLPSQEERTEVIKMLQAAPAAQRHTTLSELTWSLLTSVEFRFNH